MRLRFSRYPPTKYRRRRGVARRVMIQRTDTLVVGAGLEIDAESLLEILQPGRRVLWAFVEKDGAIQPVPYDESRCVWLSEDDLFRSEDVTEV